MQSHLLHHRQSHQVFAFAGAARFDAPRDRRSLHFLHRRFLRALPLRHVRIRYRLALDSAGYERFRIVLYHAEEAIKTAADNPGLKFTLDFNMGALNMLNLGDVINDLSYRIRPFEMTPGSTDRAVEDAVGRLSHFLETRRPFEMEERAPRWLVATLGRRPGLRAFLNGTGKIVNHLYSREFVAEMHWARQRFAEVEVGPHPRQAGGEDRRRVLGSAYRGRRQLQHVQLSRKRGRAGPHRFDWRLDQLPAASGPSVHGSQKGLDEPWPEPGWWQVDKRMANLWKYRRKWSLLRLSELLWVYLHARTARHLGGITPRLISQRELARLAHPFYHSMARGGEGHLEVGKNVYYSTRGLSHMVLALKPFGCMPSSQSDGVQSAVVNRFPEMIFLPIETAGEGEINAHSRVQMGLGEARVKARREFNEALARSGKSLAGIQEFTLRHRELRSPFYPIPRRRGIAGTAANFVLHVGELIDRRARLARLPGVC